MRKAIARRLGPLAVQTTCRLRSAAKAAQVAGTWLETPLDGEFSPIRQPRADTGLGWLTASPDALPAPLEAVCLGEFEPEVRTPSSHPPAPSGVIGLDELVSLDVVHGPRRASPATYDRWLGVLRAADPRFAFTDLPLLTGEDHTASARARSPMRVRDGHRRLPRRAADADSKHTLSSPRPHRLAVLP